MHIHVFSQVLMAYKAFLTEYNDFLLCIRCVLVGEHLDLFSL